MSKQAEKLIDFIGQSPTPYHAVGNIITLLEAKGFSRLNEQDDWSNLLPGKYYITRNDSSLIAVKLVCSPSDHGFRLIGAHTDSPCLKIKPNAVSVNNGYAKLGLEVYGGVLLNPWFDRDLGIAGRATLGLKKGGIKNVLVNFDRPIAYIPSLAIHLDREVNENRSINKQKHLPAVICRLDKGKMDFEAILKKQLKSQYPRLSYESILGFELSLYDLQPPAIVGLEKEFIASARLDNLLSCYAGIAALLASNQSSNQVVVLNDHEEVGSASTSGAQGPFLEATLSRLCRNEDSFQMALSRSMMVSADNAHGVHPNYPEVHEPAHQPLLNNGPVIKINHNQRYATSSETAAVFISACKSVRTPYQNIVVRSDMGCGSTIGPITASRIGVRTVDIGVPQWGMHSIREMAGSKDVTYLINSLRGFFQLKEWPF